MILDFSNFQKMIYSRNCCEWCRPPINLKNAQVTSSIEINPWSDQGRAIFVAVHKSIAGVLSTSKNYL